MAVQIDVISNSQRARQDLSRVARSVNNIDTVATRASRSLRNMTLGITASLGSGLAFRGLNNAADAVTTLENKLALVTRTAQEASAAQRELYAIAARSRQSIGNATDTFQKLSLALEGDYQPDQLLQVTEAIQLAAKISGATAVEASQSIRQLSQGFQGGVLRAEEYNSVIEGTPRIITAMADGLGVARGEMRQMMLDGKLTTDVMVNGLMASFQDLQSESALMTTTWAQAKGVLRDALSGFLGALWKGVGLTQRMTDKAMRLAHFFRELREVAPQWGENFRRSLQILATPLSIVISAVQLIWKGFSSLVSLVAGPLSSATSAVRSFASAIRDMLPRQIMTPGGMETVMHPFVHTIITTFKNLKGSIQQVWNDTWSEISGFGSDILDSAIQGIRNFTDRVGGLFYDLYIYLVGNSVWPDTIKEIVGWAGTLLVVAVPIISQFSGLVSGVFNKTHAAATWLFNRLPGVIQNGLSRMAPLVLPIIRVLGRFVFALAKSTRAVLLSLGIIVNSFMFAKENGIGFFEALNYHVGLAVSRISLTISMFVEDVKSVWGRLLSALGGTGVGRVLSGIVNSIASFAAKVGRLFYDLYIYLVGNSVWPDTINEIIEWAGVLWSAVKEKFRDFKEGVVNTFLSVKERLSRVFRSGSISEFFFDSFDTPTGVRRRLSPWAASILDTLKDLRARVGNFAAALWMKVPDSIRKPLALAYGYLKEFLLRIKDIVSGFQLPSLQGILSFFATLKERVSNFSFDRNMFAGIFSVDTDKLVFYAGAIAAGFSSALSRALIKKLTIGAFIISGLNTSGGQALVGSFAEGLGKKLAGDGVDDEVGRGIVLSLFDSIYKALSTTANTFVTRFMEGLGLEEGFITNLGDNFGAALLTGIAVAGVALRSLMTQLSAYSKAITATAAAGLRGGGQTEAQRAQNAQRRASLQAGRAATIGITGAGIAGALGGAALGSKLGEMLGLESAAAQMGATIGGAILGQVVVSSIADGLLTKLIAALTMTSTALRTRGRVAGFGIAASLTYLVSSSIGAGSFTADALGLENPMVALGIDLGLAVAAGMILERSIGAMVSHGEVFLRRSFARLRTRLGGRGGKIALGVALGATIAASIAYGLSQDAPDLEVSLSDALDAIDWKSSGLGIATNIAAGAAFGSIAGPIGAGLGALGGLIYGAVTDPALLQLVASAGKVVADTLARWFFNGAQLLRDMRDWLVALPSELLDAAVEAGKDIGSAIADGIKTAVSSVGEALFSQGGSGDAIALGGTATTSRREGFASGGAVFGPGTGTSDSIPAMLSNGEFVINAQSTRKFGPLLERINSGKSLSFNTGGPVSEGFTTDVSNAWRKAFGPSTEGGSVSGSGGSGGLETPVSRSVESLATAAASVTEKASEGSSALSEMTKQQEALSKLLSDNKITQSEYNDRLHEIMVAYQTSAEGIKEISALLGQEATEGMRQSFSSAILDMISGRSSFKEGVEMILDNFSMTVLSGLADSFTDSLFDSLGLKDIFDETFSNLFESFKSSFTGAANSGAEGGIWAYFEDLASSVFSGLKQAFSSVSGEGGFSLGGLFSGLFGGATPVTAATGGLIRGPGTGTSDSIPALLSNREFVMNAASTKKFLPVLQSMNSGKVPRFALGGPVSPSKARVSSMTPGSSKEETNRQDISISIQGDISRQTKKEIRKMLPEIASGVGRYNRQKGTR